MKQIILVIIFITGLKLSAQEINLPVLNQYMADNTYVLSGAYAGIGDCWQIRGSGMQQWLGVDNAPNTQTLSVDGKIHDKSGVGLILYNDSNGFTEQKGVKSTFAHHLTLDEYRKAYLSFGISYKFSQFAIDTSKFNDEQLTGIDNIQITDHNFDISLLLRIKGWFINSNVINILNKNIQYFNGEEPSSLRSYYLYSGYLIKNKLKDIVIEPSILYRIYEADSRSTTDLNLKVRKFNKENYVWGGVSLRTLTDQGMTPLSLSPMLGFKRNNIYFAYGYQAHINDFYTAQNNGSHMVTVGLDFACKKSNCGCSHNY